MLGANVDNEVQLLPATHESSSSDIDEESVQVTLDGREWHRLMMTSPFGALGLTLDLSMSPRTACDRPITGNSFYNTRERAFDGIFCPNCYTPAEIKFAAELAAIAVQRQAERVAAEEKAREEWWDAMHKRDTARIAKLKIDVDDDDK